MTRIAVLEGGRSHERQVSLRSGARVADALARLGHETVRIDAGNDLVGRVREAAPAAAFVALHGRDGEDGTVQELLELLGLPYTGSGPAACMRCSDKALAKHILRDAGLPTPDAFVFGESAFRELGAADTLPGIGERLGFPMVVKPASQGSALGLTVAHAAADLPKAIMSALSYDRRVLLERFVPGRDLAVGVLDGADGPQALPAVEAIPEGDEAYDFAARYEIGRTRFVCPAALDAGTADEARSLALAAYAALGCTGFGRVDLILGEDGALTVLEADTVPGLTETSLVPQAAEAGGLPFDALVERLVQQALARGAARPDAQPSPLG